MTIEEAIGTLQSYAEARRLQEQRILENEEWYRMRNYDGLGPARSGRMPKRKRDSVTSGYLFHSIEQKHADAMENVPAAYIRAREPGDGARAQVLSAVLPEVLKRASFRKAYSTNWHEKPKHGTGVYFVGWDPKDGKNGEIIIKAAELLRFYWQPGIEDIQDSENVFYLEFMSLSRLKGRYPEIDFEEPGKTLDSPIEPPRYRDEELNDPEGAMGSAKTKKHTPEQVCVIDWYHKVWKDGRQILKLTKFCGDTVIYSSEDDEDCKNGFYDDGRYPFVLDTMYREKGSPAGFGLIAVGKTAQRYIDRLDGNLLEQALLNSRPQILVDESLGIDPEKLADKNNQFIPFTGRIGEDSLRELRTSDPSPQVIALRTQKISEIKELTNNRDFGSGGTANGVTAASAIGLLQATGNKASRDLIMESWESFREICELVLSRMKQFYTGKRIFRITGIRAERMLKESLAQELGSGEEIGLEFDAAAVFQRKTTDELSASEIIGDEPEYDIELDAQNSGPVSEAQDNQTVFELLKAGLLNPGNEELLLLVLSVINIGKKEELIAYAENGQTYQRQIAELTAQVNQLSELLSGITGVPIEQSPGQPQTGGIPPGQTSGSGAPGFGAAEETGGARTANDMMRAASGLTPGVQSAMALGSNPFAG